MIKKFKPLSPNPTACIVAPAYGVADPNQLEEELNQTFNIVKMYGFKPMMYQDVIVPYAHSLFDPVNLRYANNDTERLRHLYQALNDKNCNIIWSFKGGYGSIRLLDGLSHKEAPISAKPFIGFSDITILHAYFNFQWQIPTIHFGMPGALQSYMKHPENIISLQNVISAKKGDVIKFQLNLISNNTENTSFVAGVTCGGNKVLFDRMMVTKFAVSLDNKILLLEDVGEAARWLDGSLEALALREDFNQLSAIIFGAFLPKEENDILQQIIVEFAAKAPIPVFQFDSQDTIGHGEINKAIILGVNAEIQSNINGTYLTIASEEFIDYNNNYTHDEL